MPSTSRPPDSRSTEAACFASSTAFARYGAMRIVVARRMRSVTARGEGDERIEIAVDDPVERAERGEATRLRAAGPVEQLYALDAANRRGESDADVHVRDYVRRDEARDLGRTRGRGDPEPP